VVRVGHRQTLKKRTWSLEDAMCDGFVTLRADHLICGDEIVAYHQVAGF
jgi:hypothetical protein